MYSLKHVLWRGAMALSLLALGIGGGFGFQQAPMQASQAPAPACDSVDAQVRGLRIIVDDDAVAVVDVVSRNGARSKRG